MFTQADLQITPTELVIRKDRYQRRNVLNIQARRLKWHQHLVRILSYALLFSAIGWVVPLGKASPLGLIVGSSLFLLGLLIALLGSRPYELRAEFRGDSETGPQWVTLARAWRLEELTLFQQFTAQLADTLPTQALNQQVNR